MQRWPAVSLTNAVKTIAVHTLVFYHRRSLNSVSIPLVRPSIPSFFIFVNCFFSCVSVVSEALAYVQLQDMLTNSSASGSHAIQHVLTALGNVAMHGQSTDQGDREDMLPLLQLLKDFVTMVRPSLPPQYLCSQKAMADM